MEYTYIQGFKDGPHRLIYLHREKHLFCYKYERSGQIEYTCYQSMLPNDYKSDSEHNCTARIIVNNNDKQCRRNNVAHTNHQNHELVFRDLQTLNAVREKSRKISEWCPLSASKVSAKEILAMELAK